MTGPVPIAATAAARQNSLGGGNDRIDGPARSTRWPLRGHFVHVGAALAIAALPADSSPSRKRALPKFGIDKDVERSDLTFANNDDI
jgi:hypothetical protein